MEITAEWLEANGYKLADPSFVGYEKKIGDLIILVGNFPFNECRVSVRVEGATIATCAVTTDDVQAVERLFGEGIVDHDEFMYVDEADLES